jgi:chromosome segregation ATPase
MSSFEKDFAEHMATDRQLAQEISRIGRTLEKNTDSLIEHMRRTEINEMNINELKSISEKIDSRLKPIENDIAGRKAVISLFMKLGGLIGGLVGLFSFLYDLFKR